MRLIGLADQGLIGRDEVLRAMREGTRAAVTHPERRVDPWLSGVDFAIAEPGREYERAVEYEQASWEAGSYGGSGGYSLAPTEANGMLGQAREALKALEALRRQTESLRAVRPPARDPASVAYNARLVSGAGAFGQGIAHIDVEIAYLKELIGKIEEAFKKITGRDAAAADDMTKVGERSPATESSTGGVIG
ncbi:hypothetical protein [Amycolatopsis speibonae]|uniref:Uncharacterized protein n=1 Tax=Amycolatopsis speibonae TaxID=1450224 RepID=A0ABV7P832_9PSEU